MVFLLVLCIAVGAFLAISLWESVLYYSVATALICIPIMIYLCYKKLQSVEDKIDEMNEKDNSENNNKE